MHPKAIIRAAHRCHLSERFIEYLTDLYRDMPCLLFFGKASLLVRPKVGVRQGSPMSPILFNMVVDELLANLKPGICYRAETFSLDVMAFDRNTRLGDAVSCGTRLGDGPEQ